MIVGTKVCVLTLTVEFDLVYHRTTPTTTPFNIFSGKSGIFYFYFTKLYCFCWKDRYIYQSLTILFIYKLVVCNVRCQDFTNVVRPTESRKLFFSFFIQGFLHIFAFLRFYLSVIESCSRIPPCWASILVFMNLAIILLG